MILDCARVSSTNAIVSLLLLVGRNAKPCVALKLITKLKLAGCVFEFPHDSNFVVEGELHGVSFGTTAGEGAMKHAREMSWLEAAEMLKYCAPVLQESKNLVSRESSGATTTSVDHRIFYLSTFLHPLRHMTCTDAKGKVIGLPTFIIRDSIKYCNKDTISVTTVLRHVDEMRSILTSVDKDSPSAFCRLRTGLLLRDLKDLWVTVLLVAAIAEMRCSAASTTHTAEEQEGDVEKQVSYYMEKAALFFRTVQQQELDGCWNVRPLLDGKAILKSLHLPKGPIIGIYLQEQVRWMLLNPNGSKDDCETHLKAVKEREQS